MGQIKTLFENKVKKQVGEIFEIDSTSIFLEEFSFEENYIFTISFPMRGLIEQMFLSEYPKEYKIIEIEKGSEKIVSIKDEKKR